MTQQEIADELIRLAGRYKMDEGRRRVSIAHAASMGQPAGNAMALPKPAESGPEIDEFSYTGTPTPPVREAESMMPASSLAPSKIPHGSLEAGRRLGAVGGRMTADRPVPLPVPGQPFDMGQLPPGYSVWDDGVKDPDGNPVRTRTPSAGDMASFLAYAAIPQQPTAAALKAMAGTARTGAEATRSDRPEEQPDAAGARAAKILQMMQDYMRGSKRPDQPITMGIRG